VEKTPPPPFVSSDTIKYCVNQKAGLLPLKAVAASGAAIKWYGQLPSGGLPANDPPLPSTDQSGTYYYFVGQKLGNCESPRAVITVVIQPISPLPLADSNIFCQFDKKEKKLKVNGKNLLWYTGSAGGTGSSTPPKIDTDKVKDDTVFVTQHLNNACESKRVSVIIKVKEKPVAKAGPDRKIDLGESVVLNGNASRNDVEVSWTPAETLLRANTLRPTAKPSVTTVYTLRVTSEHGCTDEDDAEVVVLQPVNVPNVFSPNGDGIHDRWVIPDIEQYPNCTLQIYNRLGVKVFEQKGYNSSNAWDGTSKGTPLPVGAYYYLLDYGESKPGVNGVISIIR
jgi:gliding motility-associated-like protein